MAPLFRQMQFYSRPWVQAFGNNTGQNKSSGFIW
jgi:hypothetical protein